MRASNLLKSQRGITLIEAIASISILSGVMLGATEFAQSHLADTRAVTAAQQIASMGEAAKAYMGAKQATVASRATATQACLIRASDMSAYLGGFDGTNVYGQTLSVLVLEPTAGNLQAVVVAAGGQVIGDVDLAKIANATGGGGGGVYAGEPSRAVGVGSTWSLDLSAAPGSAYRVAPTLCETGAVAAAAPVAVGSPVMALWMTDMTGTAGAMRRGAVAGAPEANTMNTPIIMAAGTIQTLNAACTTKGAIGRVADGGVVSCAGAAGSEKWSPASGGESGSWKDPVATASALPAAGNDIGDARVAQDTGGAYIWNGAAWRQVTPASGDFASGVLRDINALGTVSSDRLLVSGDMDAQTYTLTHPNNTVHTFIDSARNLNAGTLNATGILGPDGDASAAAIGYDDGIFKSGLYRSPAVALGLTLSGAPVLSISAIDGSISGPPVFRVTDSTLAGRFVLSGSVVGMDQSGVTPWFSMAPRGAGTDIGLQFGALEFAQNGAQGTEILARGGIDANEYYLANSMLGTSIRVIDQNRNANFLRASLRPTQIANNFVVANHLFASPGSLISSSAAEVGGALSFDASPTALGDFDTISFSGSPSGLTMSTQILGQIPLAAAEFSSAGVAMLGANTFGAGAGADGANQFLLYDKGFYLKTQNNRNLVVYNDGGWLEMAFAVSDFFLKSALSIDHANLVIHGELNILGTLRAEIDSTTPVTFGSKDASGIFTLGGDAAMGGGDFSFHHKTPGLLSILYGPSTELVSVSPSEVKVRRNFSPGKDAAGNYVSQFARSFYTTDAFGAVLGGFTPTELVVSKLAVDPASTGDVKIIFNDAKINGDLRIYGYNRVLTGSTSYTGSIEAFDFYIRSKGKFISELTAFNPETTGVVTTAAPGTSSLSSSQKCVATGMVLPYRDAINANTTAGIALVPNGSAGTNVSVASGGSASPVPTTLSYQCYS